MKKIILMLALSAFFCGGCSGLFSSHYENFYFQPDPGNQIAGNFADEIAGLYSAKTTFELEKCKIGNLCKINDKSFLYALSGKLKKRGFAISSKTGALSIELNVEEKFLSSEAIISVVVSIYKDRALKTVMSRLYATDNREIYPVSSFMVRTTETGA